jgi:hypothetical protein
VAPRSRRGRGRDCGAAWVPWAIPERPMQDLKENRPRNWSGGGQRGEPGRPSRRSGRLVGVRSPGRPSGPGRALSRGWLGGGVPPIRRAAGPGPVAAPTRSRGRRRPGGGRDRSRAESVAGPPLGGGRIGERAGGREERRPGGSRLPGLLIVETIGGQHRGSDSSECVKKSSPGREPDCNLLILRG